MPAQKNESLNKKITFEKHYIQKIHCTKQLISILKLFFALMLSKNTKCTFSLYNFKEEKN